jgi:nucleotide-binding universal stress UspA family protein
MGTMLNINKVLFPTDFSPCADQALVHASYLAGKYLADFHMLHAIVLHEDDPHNPAHHFDNIADVHDKLVASARERMASLMKEYAVEGITTRQIQLRGIAPAPVILEYARESDIDLIVMGTHGRRGLGHFLLGSVAEEVVRLASCPVLTIREEENPRPIEAVENILVPLDFSDHARNALRHALEMAETYGAGLQLLHVVEDNLHPYYAMAGTNSILELQPDIKEKSKEAMEKILEETKKKDIKADLHVVVGHPAREIISFADDHETDLIVIATHGLTGIEHLLMGSVTEKVVRMSQCPVFTVKSFGKLLL